ncbi:MAG: hypothetical protein VW080_10840, partial [Flavobacteriaceae bacterium]
MKSAFFLLITFLLVNCTHDSSAKKNTSLTESWAFPYFKKVDSLNPILQPTKNLSFIDPVTKNKVFWEERNVLNPAAIVRNDTVYMLYRA